MSKRYRLKPVSERMWVVQEKGWFFWYDCVDGFHELKRAGLFGGDITILETLYVHSEREGVAKIVELRDRDLRLAGHRASEREFLRHAKPVEPRR